MIKIEIKSIFHQNKNQLGLYFKYNHHLIDLAKSIGCKFSNTNKCWYIENNTHNLQQIKQIFTGHALLTFHKDIVPLPVKSHQRVNSVPSELSKDVEDELLKFKYWLNSKRYAESTIKTYLECIKTFLKFFGNKPVEKITNEDVITFNNQYILINNLSASFQSQVINALKLFYSTQQNKAIVSDSLIRPKKYTPLPNVLSKAEVKKILNSLTNPKHRVMLSLIYSCGLRRSELLNLKPMDIDSNRKLIIIRKSKGNKDRIVPLSVKILGLLREYYQQFKPAVWLFEGQKVGNPYDERSLASVLNKAVRNSKINKPVTLHWLRHSYATHLLESGTDLRYIQEILGHKSSKTTEIYTHVSSQKIQEIKSPFDDLDI